VASILDAGAEFDSIFGDGDEEPAAEEQGSVRLSEAERDVLNLIDGQRDVGLVAEQSGLGEFETYRTLADLVSRDLLREVESARRSAPAEPQRAWVAPAIRIASALTLGLGIFVGLYTLDSNPYTPWRALEHGELEGGRS
jgi:hypothetical protein